MKLLCKTLPVLALIALVVPSVRAADQMPNINKRGDDEKAFVEKLATAVVKAARTSVKTASLDRFEKKSPKDGRTELHIKAGFKGAATGATYAADIIVVIDSSDKEKWEVLRIDYSDNSKSAVGFNRKNVESLVKQFNAK